MFKRILIISGVVLLGLLLAVAALVFWRNRVIQQRSQAALQRVEEALAADNARGALAMINARPPAGRSDAEERRWLEAEVEACARLGQIARLQSLHGRDPGTVRGNEDAALLLARALLHGGDEAAALEIANAWQEKSPRAHLWFAFRVDAALLNGRREEALRRLQEREFAGSGDSVRLSRLALLAARDDPAAAWNFLARAYEANPRDVDVRSFRGQILETLGSNRLARVEYVAAHVANPANVVARDQLAEFYRRRGGFVNALETWLPAVTNNPPGFVPLKARFWSRVARPVVVPRADVSVADPLRELVAYLEGRGEGEFWNADDFVLLANGASFERARQEVFWLKLLEALRAGRPDAALELLRTNPFRERSFDPLLERSLYHVLSWRKHGRLDAYGVEFSAFTPSTNRHTFLLDLHRHGGLERASGRAVELPESLSEVLGHADAPALVFLAAGWLRAGLDLTGGDPWSETDPAWPVYAVTQARRAVRGSADALAYATNQPVATPTMRLLIGELRLATGDTDAALADLRPLVPATDAVGYRAAWLVGNAALERRDHEALAAVVARQPRLGVAGQELLARSALIRGDTNQVERIYRGIVAESVPAKAFLMQLAFARKDWKTAREMTEALLLVMPDELVLRRNLERIAKAEAGGR